MIRRNLFCSGPIRPQFLILLLVFTSSCSWISSDRSSVDKAEPPPSASAPPKETGPVSRDKYNDLLKKYRALQYQGAGAPTAKNARPIAVDPKLLQDLNEANAATGGQLGETVDVFGKSGISTGRKQAPSQFQVGPATQINEDVLRAEIKHLETALDHMDKKQYNEAMKYLQALESSRSKQVRVRAKFQIGVLLFAQKEYDLAQQVFDSIIQGHAYSGLVIKALEYGAACSDKLGQVQKKEQYISILKDVFKAG
ncbi:MAG: hypothetical protein HOE90_21600 [Bacteriovoracaceae bacterium]|nr:hypothetical protein [Bacteriovoracaceae bacterium]